MHYEWIKNSSFWLTLALPMAIVLAIGVVRFDVFVDSGRQLIPVVIVCLGLACLIGISIVKREHKLRQLAQGNNAVHGSDSSLSTEQAATYRDLFENATDIVFTTDLSGHFLAGNKAVQRLLGYTVEEAKSLTWEKLVAPYDMGKARQMYKRHAGGERTISFELDTVTASGEIKTFEIGSRPMFQSNELCGFHGIARDITLRKEMEKQLESARCEAETANESKSTFLANMSHEIRTPINGILGFLALFAKTDLTFRQKEYLGPVEESAKHLLKIINDILDLSKIEAGRLSIENEVFNYRDIVKSSVDLLRPLGENKGLVIDADFDRRIPRFVVGDGTRVGQIISNLVSNAIKFTDAGSVLVQNQVKETSASRLLLRVAVRDTGIGIAPEYRVKLFEPFHQLDARPDRRYSGTGLGLTISRTLVEAMGGEIKVYSDPGEYTEVGFELPFGFAPDNIETATREAADMSHRFNGAGLSAVIVDDNEINRWYLGAVLDQCGLEVQQVSSGGSALEACKERRFDVVFMDIHMADMDGIETTRRLRTQIPWYRDVPVVAVSADVVGDSGTRFTDQGLDRFIAKPVKEDDLVDLLATIFPNRAARHESETLKHSHNTDVGKRCVLNRAQGLTLASRDEKLWRRSVDVLRRQARDTVPRLRAAVEGRDHGELQALAHRLAGSAGYVAAEELAHHARILVQAAQRREYDSINVQLGDLDRAVERLCDIDIESLA
ncbi:MAG: Sensory/regulatory protein RpfC [Gammaproteobacteria bacterium]|nr:Sensory/regulatory protein RpfC [Gammaproteobacteria bacterium]